MKNQTVSNNNNKITLTKQMSNQSSSRSISTSNQKQKVGSANCFKIKDDTRIQSESSEAYIILSIRILRKIITIASTVPKSHQNENCRRQIF